MFGYFHDPIELNMHKSISFDLFDISRRPLFLFFHLVVLALIYRRGKLWIQANKQHIKGVSLLYTKLVTKCNFNRQIEIFGNLKFQSYLVRSVIEGKEALVKVNDHARCHKIWIHSLGYFEFPVSFLCRVTVVHR